MELEKKVSNLVATEAVNALESSYSPYSNYAVGAAILLKDGKVVKGANIENAAYGLCMCAERVAMFRMHMEGYNKADVVAMAVASRSKAPVSPCGSCRQVMAELLDKDTPIILTNDKLEIKETTVCQLLPYSFTNLE